MSTNSRRLRLPDLLLAAAAALAIAALAGLAGAFAGTPGAGRAAEASIGLDVRLARTLSRPDAVRSAQWCGGSAAATDRQPDLLGGDQIHVIYALPSDGPDRFGVYADRIVTDLTAIDAWWRRQDPARTLRFDLHAFPGCPSGLSQADVSLVRLPHDGAYFTPLDDRLRRLAIDLADTFDADSKKYLVYYDGPLEDTGDYQVCGTAFRGPANGGGTGSVAAVWMQTCTADVGSGNILAAIATHETLHQLGVLPPGAPHACPGDDGHPCDYPLDIMYPSLSANFAEEALDLGRDDYYGHSGTWFDAQDSSWLTRADGARAALSITLRSAGDDDRVISDPVGIDCPRACSVLFDAGSQVRVAAMPGDGSRLVGWSGACSGKGVCTVALAAATSVEAQFGPSSYRLSISVAGKGRVAASPLGLTCARLCAESVDADSVVRLRATPAKGWRFKGWSGACRGTRACSVQLSANRVVRATFRKTR